MVGTNRATSRVSARPRSEPPLRVRTAVAATVPRLLGAHRAGTRPRPARARRRRTGRRSRHPYCGPRGRIADSWSGDQLLHPRCRLRRPGRLACRAGFRAPELRTCFPGAAARRGRQCRTAAAGPSGGPPACCLRGLQHRGPPGDHCRARVPACERLRCRGPNTLHNMWRPLFRVAPGPAASAPTCGA